MTIQTPRPLGKQKQNPIWLILAFAIPMIAMWIGFAFCKVHPFGDMQMLYSDLREQYYPFFQEFQYRILNGESLLWSWNGGMGTDYISLIAYYIASPLNIFSLLFPASMLRDALALFLTIKIGCAGLFFAIMLKKIFGKNDFSITAFGWMFAFCSFIMGYYWDVIWMDSVALLPLVFLGLYSLITEGKFRLYVISLAVAIFANYYIGVFICYFCVIAFFAIAAIRQIFGKPFLSRLLQFGGCSLLAGGLTAVLLLHTVFALSYTDSAASGSFTDLEFYDSFLSVIGNMLAFNNPTAMEGLPNLYVGVLPLLLSVVYLRSKKIRLEDKIINVVFLAFFIFASNFNALDFILHGFRFPNMLPGRYTFLICFVLLLVGYRGFLLLKDLSTSDIFGMAVLSITMLGLSCFSLGENKVLGNIILVAAYLLFFFLYERRLLRKTAFAVFICLMITAEMISSLVLSMDTVGKTSYTNYPYRQEEITDLNEALEDLDPTFWRTEMTCRYYLNDGVMYSYRGIGQFSSTANRGVRDLMSHLSFTTGANSYYYNFSSPLNNALLGLKYLTSRSGELISGTFVEPYFEANNLKVYENTAYIGTGFMVDSKTLDMQFTNSPFQVQNNLFQALTGSESNIFYSRQEDRYESYGFESIEKTGSGTYVYTTNKDDGILDITFTAGRTGTYYAYMRVGGGGDITVTTSSGKVFDHPVAHLRYIAPVCSVEAGETIRVSITADPNETNKTISFYFYYFNDQLFEEGWSNLSDETWTVDEFSDTHLKGEITVKEKGLFCTVIPYTEDWTMYVDGRETETVPLLDNAYIGAYLTEGTHTVELVYTPKGLTAGIVITVICIVIFALLCVFFRKGFPAMQTTPDHRTPEEIAQAQSLPADREREPVEEPAEEPEALTGITPETAPQPLPEPEQKDETEAKEDDKSDESANEDKND
ncbi:MAG: YfhO family protein [Clostridia bacterium]|nr:YfhO family protein [Clostridia bacterium]